LQLPAGVQRALADGAMTAGHARALLGTPDRAFQEELARRTVSEGLTVRAVEDLVRRHSAGEEPQPEMAPAEPSGDEQPQALHRPVAVPDRRPLPAPGLLELEELLSAHLNTRVKVEMTAKRGKVMVEFATLEDLERIYKLMVGGAV
ncbi:MAG TPA: chromosome partitioning protein ParB, partial [Acidimicrobiales bacterium]|nr:chromosome partitioning protein ParB [Acidimicrobiales bacterium]